MGSHVLIELSDKGDTRLEWNLDNADEVRLAREHFNALKAKRYLAYKLDLDNERGEQIREFDPTAERIVMSPQLVGG